MNFVIFLLICIYMFSSHANKFQITKPTRFYVDPSNLQNIASSAAQFAFRLGSGGFVQGYSASLEPDTEKTMSMYSIARSIGLRIDESSTFTKPNNIKRPIKKLEIYEFEGCPFCRKVREAICILDLDALFYPCPRGGPNFRTKVQREGGKAQFPYFVDPNTKTSMYESDDIIAYLFDEYGSGEVPSILSPSILTTLSCSLAMLPRINKGSAFVESKQPKKPLIYWGYEASPFCKVVRERLVELEIPHLYKSVARGSSKRQEMVDKVGFFQAPFLQDPNTGIDLFESLDIIKYLDQSYSVSSENILKNNNQF